jgi:cytochrome c oxidase assembly protein subunit 15
MQGQTWFRYSAIAALGLCWVTIILGGNVIATNSGLGCPTWPSCNGGWNLFPTLAGATGIEWTHRVAAFFLAISILLLTTLALAYERARPAFVRLSVAALALVVLLAFLGGAVVDSGLDIGLVLLHFGVATILFAILLVLALLANWKNIPRHWKEWARRTTEPGDAPPATPGAAPPNPTPPSMPSEPTRSARS